MDVIIRVSLNNDQQSRLRNAFAPILENAGLVRTSTATWKGNIEEATLRRALSDFWQIVANYLGPASLDHFWMYADKPAAAEEALEAAA